MLIEHTKLFCIFCKMSVFGFCFRHLNLHEKFFFSRVDIFYFCKFLSNPEFFGEE